MGKTNTEKNKRYSELKRKNIGSPRDITEAIKRLCFKDEYEEMVNLNLKVEANEDRN